MACAVSRPDRTTRPPGATILVKRRGEPLQRLEQDIGEDEIERRAGADRRRGDAVRAHHLDQRAGAIEPGIGARHAHGRGIDVGREHAPAQGAGGGDGEDARAGAEIENARRRAAGANDLHMRSSASRQPRVVP